MTGAADVISRAVLRDYPLRLWAQQQEHSQEVLREFTLLLIGQEELLAADAAPRQLVELAEMFSLRFGPLLDQISLARQEALDAGRDRMDSEVALVTGMPELLAQVDTVLRAVDEYCRHGDLLTLARPPEVVALFDWARTELVKQYEGSGEPAPWPGPF